MSNSLLLVNTHKREYCDPMCFGENQSTGSYMQGYHAVAVAMLVCPSPGLSLGPLDGSWNGDKIVAATEAASPDQYGFKTGTESFPGRNLYRMAHDEFKNISYLSLAMVCNHFEAVADALAKRAKLEFDHSSGESTSLLWHLGNCFSKADGYALDEALLKYFGDDWTDTYERSTQY